MGAPAAKHEVVFVLSEVRKPEDLGAISAIVDIMRPLVRLFGLLPALLDVVSAVNIFVSHYQGTVQSLTLTATSGGAYTLTTNGTVTIGGQPSWLTWDSPNRVLYVADEGNSGSVTSVTAGTDGSLKKLGQCSAPGGAVANTLYANGGYIASVH